VDNPEIYQFLLKELRYFEFEGRPCRGLPSHYELNGKKYCA